MRGTFVSHITNLRNLLGLIFGVMIKITAKKEFFSAMIKHVLIRYINVTVWNNVAMDPTNGQKYARKFLKNSEGKEPQGKILVFIILLCWYIPTIYLDLSRCSEGTLYVPLKCFKIHSKINIFPHNLFREFGKNPAEKITQMWWFFLEKNNKKLFSFL